MTFKMFRITTFRNFILPRVRAAISHRTRLAWMLAAAVCYAVYFLSLPPHFKKIIAFETDYVSNTELIELAGIPVEGYAWTFLGLSTLLAVAHGLLGALIIWARPKERMAVISAYIMILFGVSIPNTIPSLETVAGAPVWLVFVVKWIGILGFGLFFVQFYVFPDGRFFPAWTKWVALMFFLTLLITEFFPDSILNINAWSPAISLGVPLLYFSTMVYAQIARFRQLSDAVQRQQTKWVVFSLVAAILTFMLVPLIGLLLPLQDGSRSALFYSIFSDTAYFLAFLFVPAGFGIAVLRFRLWDIDFIVNRALVYAVLTICVAGAYILLVGYLGAVFQSGDNLLISLIATGVVAVLFQPARDYVQRSINRLMYGQRDDPFSIVSHLGAQLEVVSNPEVLLQALLRTIVEGLKLSSMLIQVFERDSGTTRTMASFPADLQELSFIQENDRLSIPLTHQSIQIGTLVIGMQPNTTELNPVEMRLLRTISSQIGATVRTIQLTDDLQRSRDLLIQTREEERRRIRRDLHDGLGPVLASVALQADIARENVRTDPAKAEELIGRTILQAQSAIGDVRRLVDELRPARVDELGLAGALQAYVDNISAGPLLSIEIPEILPDLPAAIELAVFRIVQEGVNNVIRHAQASRCKVTVRLLDDLLIKIEDDGRGIPDPVPAGLGLRSMHNRVEELGGVLHLQSSALTGTVIEVKLPVSLPPTARALDLAHRESEHGKNTHSDCR